MKTASGALANSDPSSRSVPPAVRLARQVADGVDATRRGTGRW